MLGGVITGLCRGCANRVLELEGPGGSMYMRRHD